MCSRRRLRPSSVPGRRSAAGDNALVIAPTGSGKTLAAFLWALDSLTRDPIPAAGQRCRVLYVSPLKALAVDVERNLRAPLAGITQTALAARPGATKCAASRSAPATLRRRIVAPSRAGRRTS